MFSLVRDVIIRTKPINLDTNNTECLEPHCLSMGLFKFLNLPLRKSKTLDLLSHKTTNDILYFYILPSAQSNAEIDHITNLITPLKTLKHHIFSHRNSNNRVSCNYYCRSFYRLVHGGLVQSQEFTDKIINDADKICKIVSNHSISSIDASLDNALVEVSPTLVVEVLRKLSNAGVIALSFFRWAEKQNGFGYSAEGYNALIEALGKIKQFKKIWDLVGEMKHKGLLTKETFALITRRYARARKVKEAVETFEKIETFGLKPELSDFNRLIDTLSKSRNVRRAQEVFDKMNKRRFTPDIKSYTILLEGWGQEQNLLRLDEVYREMRDEGFEPDIVTYGIIINAHCRARKCNKAIELFREMEAKKCKPSPHIYCSLINSLGSEKRLSEALEFFEQYKANGFPPEIPTYNALVGCFCWSMRLPDAYRVVDEMMNCGVGPNARTYDIILHHLIKAGRTKEAYSVFQKMSCEPSLSTYEIIVRMFCNEERVDMALRVWDQMKAKGVLPGMHMFSTLINSLCHENKLEDACKYFDEMLDTGIRPPGQMFGNLKQALLDEGRKDTALLLCQKLDKLRKTPLIG